MHIFKFPFLLILLTSCWNTPRVRIPTDVNIEVDKKFNDYLKEGEYKVEYYPGKEVTPEHKKIIQKLSKLIETNARTQKYFSKIKEGEKVEYNSNIGISRQEYDLLNDLFVYKAPKKHNGTLTISKNEDLIVFKGDGKLNLLDSVTVNINRLSASFKQYNMKRIRDSIDLSNEDIPIGDTLETYEFYSGPDGLLGLTGLDGAYELLIGKLMPSGRTYLSFFARQPFDIEHPIPDYITVILD